MDDALNWSFFEDGFPPSPSEPEISLPSPTTSGPSSMDASKDQPEFIVIDSDPADLVDDTPPKQDEIWTLFPNICPLYVAELRTAHGNQIHAVISAILDKQEEEGKYPTQPDPNRLSRKRKRSDDGGASGLSLAEGGDNGMGDIRDEENDPDYVNTVKSKIAKPGYAAIVDSKEYQALAKRLLSQEFPKVPLVDIRNQLALNGGSIFMTYTAMDEQLRNTDRAPVPWRMKKRASKPELKFTPDRLPHLDMSAYKPDEQAAFAEFSAARKLRTEKDTKITVETEERNNLARARMLNQTAECGICCEECAINRMVECQGETPHRFCSECMRTQAETQIGMAKYQLTCMSMDGCSAGFSLTQKKVFLNEKLTTALDRIEQEEVLRMAGIENLETCPFCPNAAEYPPVEVDKEFRCDNPICLKVSCRLCRRLTHIPKTCAEDEADRGLDARHTLEEAMSEALIRRCNKCSYPFVKLDGCNKITCTKCGTIQCDVCRRTITNYGHFDDERRGGKVGQCPLFDRSEERHNAEVSNAATETRKKVLGENPRIDEKALHLDMPGTANAKTKESVAAVVRPEVPAWLRTFERHLERPLHDLAIPPASQFGQHIFAQNLNKGPGLGNQAAFNRHPGSGNLMLPMMQGGLGKGHAQPGIQPGQNLRDYPRPSASFAPSASFTLGRPIPMAMPIPQLLAEQIQKRGGVHNRGGHGLPAAPPAGQSLFLDDPFWAGSPAQLGIPPRGMPQPTAVQRSLLQQRGIPLPSGPAATFQTPGAEPNRPHLHRTNLFLGLDRVQPFGAKGWGGLPMNDDAARNGPK